MFEKAVFLYEDLKKMHDVTYVDSDELQCWADDANGITIVDEYVSKSGLTRATVFYFNDWHSASDSIEDLFVIFNHVGGNYWMVSTI